MSGAEREQRGVLIVPTPLWLTLLWCAASVDLHPAPRHLPRAPLGGHHWPWGSPDHGRRRSPPRLLGHCKFRPFILRAPPESAGFVPVAATGSHGQKWTSSAAAPAAPTAKLKSTAAYESCERVGRSEKTHLHLLWRKSRANNSTRMDTVACMFLRAEGGCGCGVCVWGLGSDSYCPRCLSPLSSLFLLLWAVLGSPGAAPVGHLHQPHRGRLSLSMLWLRLSIGGRAGGAALFWGFSQRSGCASVGIREFCWKLFFLVLATEAGHGPEDGSGVVRRGYVNERWNGYGCLCSLGWNK